MATLVELTAQHVTAHASNNPLTCEELCKQIEKIHASLKALENGGVDHLRDCGAHVKFLSMEPLLGSTQNLRLQGIDWVIVGGESGPGARPAKEEWVIEIKEQCLSANAPFFFKQWGGFRKKKAGRELEGKTWDQMPRIRQPQRALREAYL